MTWTVALPREPPPLLAAPGAVKEGALAESLVVAAGAGDGAGSLNSDYTSPTMGISHEHSLSDGIERTQLESRTHTRHCLDRSPARVGRRRRRWYWRGSRRGLYRHGLVVRLVFLLHFLELGIPGALVVA